MKKLSTTQEYIISLLKSNDSYFIRSDWSHNYQEVTDGKFQFNINAEGNPFSSGFRLYFTRPTLDKLVELGLIKQDNGNIFKLVNPPNK